MNGDVMGVYANVETYDDISLPVLFDSTQHMYEADLPDVDVYPGGQADFEVDEGDDEDLADLEALIAAANDEVGDWSDGMGAVADLEEMTRMWAVERYVGHWDGYAGAADPPGFEIRPNNYYLHSDDLGVFQMAPWGADQTMTTHLGFAEEAGGLMFNKCFADASCKGLYDEALEDLQALAPTLELHSKAERYASNLTACQELEVEPRRVHSAEAIAAGVEEVVEFVDSRRIPLREYLENSSPPVGPEEANPPTEEPCGPDPPEPPQPPAAPAGAPPAAASAVPAPKLVFGPTKAKGASVSTTITAPAAGVATQLVRAKSGGKWVKACSARKAAAGAGRVKISCRLAGWAVELAEDGQLRLKVKVGFDPTAGPLKSVNRRLTA
jgi:hypothetical protein